MAKKNYPARWEDEAKTMMRIISPRGEVIAPYRGEFENYREMDEFFEIRPTYPVVCRVAHNKEDEFVLIFPDGGDEYVVIYN